MLLVTAVFFGPFAAQADTSDCISVGSSRYKDVASVDDTTVGRTVISSIITTMNAMLAGTQKGFYERVVKNANFQRIIAASVLLYIVIFGFLVLTASLSLTPQEIVLRVIKVSIVWSLLYYDPKALLETEDFTDIYGNVYHFTGISAWHFFFKWVQFPLLNGMNELITFFTSVLQSTPITPHHSGVTATGLYVGIDQNVFNFFADSIGKVMSAQFTVTLVTLWFCGPVGIFLSFFLLWAVVQFFMLIAVSILTYIRCIFILSFLIGMAPILLCLMLFEKTRPIFDGWKDQVIGYTLQPILLFAFLSSFVFIISNSLQQIFPPGYQLCWQVWLDLKLFQIHMWLPAAYIWKL